MDNDKLAKVIEGLKVCTNPATKRGCLDGICPYDGKGCRVAMERDALELLKEQKNLKEKLLRNIADNQLAVAPTGYETEEGLAKRTGEWNGLQMAYEIVKNDGN